ncbi:MAG TPA: hypothetical protein VN892_05550 [Solirubrobacteraceae bacterium]|nr:hypothetical protein [Solirubrobacteraceae bacterium]
MRLRNIAKSTRVRVSAVLLALLLAAGLTVALTVSSAAPSAFQECMGAFTQSEREGGEQWLKEKIASQEKECRYLAHLNETISPQQDREDKERARATLKPGALATGTLPQRVTGIENGSGGGPPGMSGVFLATGHWVGLVGGKWYIVWAGAKRVPPSEEPVESAVVVYLQPQKLGSAETSTFVGTYGTPAGERQPLTIAAANEGVLTLKTSTEQTLSFDVATQTFG